jgi:hypothetical protein
MLMCRSTYSLFQRMQLANSAGDPPKRKCGSLHAPMCSRGLDGDHGGLRGRLAWNDGPILGRGQQERGVAARLVDGRSRSSSRARAKDCKGLPCSLEHA